VLARNARKIAELLSIFETRLFIASLLAKEGDFSSVETLCRPARLPDALEEVLEGVPAEVIDFARDLAANQLADRRSL
jgi:hypothetical protein